MRHERLILFTRFPVAGRTKTRLIPRLGSEGAAQLQREMTEHALARVWPIIKRRGVELEVRFEDGSAAGMRRWLGGNFKCVPQGPGDLGARMSRATEEALAAGMQAVVVIGADCPAADSALIESAFESLRTHSVVFGPARDGGYYLVGVREAGGWLFEGIPWGTREVQAISGARARQHGIEPYFLTELSDIDEPGDLEEWEKVREAGRTISVIIPTLNEAAQLARALEHAAAGQPKEIIVADGGSGDETARIAEAAGAKVLRTEANRARQMNAGAAVALGETLLFLHADTRLPGNYADPLLAALRRPDVVGGAFSFRITNSFPGRRLVESTTNLRSHLWRLPYGDQALFVRRWAFDELGGFPDLPIMEDYEFVRRLRRLGRLALLKEAVLTSGRRWQRLGFLRATLINKLVILGYHCGVPPVRLAALYRGRTWRTHSGLARTAIGPTTI